MSVYLEKAVRIVDVNRQGEQATLLTFFKALHMILKL